ncbi:RNA polymerase sigma-70 factor, ECF subfamily [Mariniphaga anaerophila]|uniref:RNA polymerase sigma-70 factor, ECF subfamily n=1 Tax=Mariniphaga anaerophila TaxID=1484053 RepID=A0A1M5AMU2_9BACT|nr:sigma-70 family RNA polymerase sigma factor [Mariniphaga anaerophila]SHF31543.1 RNA polymerase sigma-70 factor, ECF subfamily [Mariniphaga anaerophila]
MEKQYQNIHQKLIDLCREGNQKAQFQLYKLYYRSMYSVSLRIVNDDAEAEDVMQEAFLKAFKKMDTYKGEVSFGAWLKKIVVNSSLDHLKKKRAQLVEMDESVNALPEENEAPGEVDVAQIQKAIRSLPDGYRTVLSLYLIEGYDHDEISQILGVSNSASRTQYSRAKNKLRELLKEKKIFLYN